MGYKHQNKAQCAVLKPRCSIHTNRISMRKVMIPLQLQSNSVFFPAWIRANGLLRIDAWYIILFNLFKFISNKCPKDRVVPVITYIIEAINNRLLPGVFILIRSTVGRKSV